MDYGFYTVHSWRGHLRWPLVEYIPRNITESASNCNGTVVRVSIELFCNLDAERPENSKTQRY